jgi:hypothetical protein
MGTQVNIRGEGPRYEPTYGDISGDTFLGYANELDVWYDPEGPFVCVVGPDHKLLGLDSDQKEVSGYNFDLFKIEDGLLVLFETQNQDLHIDVHDMSLIYQLCVEHQLLEL